MSVRRSMASPCELPLEGARLRARHPVLELGDAEVHDLGHPFVGHEEVVRGHVPVNEVQLLAVFALQLVSGVEAIGGFGDDAASDLGRHRRAHLLGPSHDLAERLAVEVLHGDPVRVLVLAELEDGRDVRVRDARRDVRLVEEHVHERLVLDEVRVDPLDGEPPLEAAEPIDPGEVHARHPAEANLVDDAVAAEEVCLLRGDAAYGRDVGHVRVVWHVVAPRQWVTTWAPVTSTSLLGLVAK
jgi:hypothetical protein